MISGLRSEGVTVFLTTHYLEEAERLCDRIAIIVKGRIVALDNVSNLKSSVQQSGRAIVEITLVDGENGTETHKVEAQNVAAAVQAALVQAGDKQVLAVNTVRPSLEDVFIKLTGLSAEVMLAEKGGKGGGNAGG
jgi:ABC-2 type transport system ATP-binding protein